MLPGMPEYPTNTALGKAGGIKHVTLYQMLAQSAGGPRAKLHALLRLDAIANGDNDIQIVVLNAACNRSGTLDLNLCKFCTSCRNVQLPLLKHIAQMLGHHRALATKQCRHLLLRQTHRLRIRPHIHLHLHALGFVDQHFTHHEFLSTKAMCKFCTHYLSSGLTTPRPPLFST